MKTIRLALGLFFLVVVNAAMGLPPVKNSGDAANPIFQEILSRVAERDEDTHVILNVRAREGCSRYPNKLSFSITQARQHDEVVVVLRWNNKGNDGVYEKYRLVIDNAIRVELSNQQKFQAKLERIAEAARKERDKRFKQLAGGRLTYGMTQGEVENVLGKPTSVEPYRGAQATREGSRDSWVYDNFRVRFHGGITADITALRVQE